ncbi:DUF488 domain-containing protein [Actinomadura fibrosa]|uniref:DUF488 domain-containing protein n=1 Tax=Actinomadura fibrosa TaxID=111802 RepID=A0ABW2Y1G4_9ACTN|nr:DUF488 family protein [Actinomadura fibrosa]
MGKVRTRRAHDPAERGDGARVLVDRVWPRGLSKDKLDLTEWLKDVAPSTELRKWYGHDPDRFGEFRDRYLRELKDPERREALDRLRELRGKGTLTLLTATRDVDISQAAVLASLLNEGGDKD